MQVTKEEAEQETRKIPIRTLAFTLFTVLTLTLITSASAQPPFCFMTHYVSFARAIPR